MKIPDRNADVVAELLPQEGGVLFVAFRVGSGSCGEENAEGT